MCEMAEDRIYADRTEGATLYVAAGAGLVTVAVAGNRIGRFRIDRRGECTDVATGAGRLVVATPEDVLVGRRTGDEGGVDDGGRGDDGAIEYEHSGFGPAVAVGVDAGDPVAARSDGTIGRRVDGEWFEIAAIDGTVRAIDGGLVAASDGVYRASPDGLDYVGLDDARDVASEGPYAATGEGLYELGNGWIRAVEGAFDAVAATGDRAHAAGEDLYVGGQSGWQRVAVEFDGTIAGIAHAGGTYAVTADGTALAAAGDGRPTDASGDDGDGREDSDPGEGWRTRSLGVRDVGGIAVPTPIEAATGSGNGTVGGADE